MYIDKEHIYWKKGLAAIAELYFFTAQAKFITAKR